MRLTHPDLPPHLEGDYERIVAIGMRLMTTNETVREHTCCAMLSGDVVKRLPKALMALTRTAAVASGRTVHPALVYPVGGELLAQTLDVMVKSGDKLDPMFIIECGDRLQAELEPWHTELCEALVTTQTTEA